MAKTSKSIGDRPIIGWREWIELPDFDNCRIKAKIDTGAKTSALHAENITFFEIEERQMVKFDVFPKQRSRECFRFIAPLKEMRQVKSSSGHKTTRPIIETTLSIGGRDWTIELGLVPRDMMGFRMLIGRDSVAKRFIVDPAASFLNSKHEASIQRKSRI